VLELARWLAARSRGAYLNLNVRGTAKLAAGMRIETLRTG
jgi:hypothetical protein